MDFRVTHEVVYDFEDEASVGEVAKSLTAQEKLFIDALRVIEECFPDLDIEGARLAVREVSQNSPLRHRLEGYIIAALSPGLTADMPQDLIQAIFGYDVPDSIDGFVSLVMLLVSMWGAEKLVHRLRRFRDKADQEKLEAKELTLAAERRRLTTIAANRASISEDQLTEALATTLSKRTVTVGKYSMDFLAPAKRHAAASIKLPHGEEIGRSAIEALPSEVELAQYQPPFETETYEDVTVNFLRHDKTKPKDWAATIGEVSPDRKPLHLAPDIRPDELFTRESVKGDVMVTSVLGPDGEYVPSFYYLSKLTPEGASAGA